MNRPLHRQNTTLRRLHVFDRAEICAHFLRLDPNSRRARFCGSISDEGVKSYVKRIFCHDSIVCGAFVDGKLRGLAELRGVFPGWASVTEAAFSVESDWQNSGIGDALFERLFAIARNRGVRTLQMMCLKENNRMKHLAVKHHARLQHGPDVTEALLDPNWPTPASIAQEVFDETRGCMDAIVGWSKRRIGRKALQPSP